MKKKKAIKNGKHISDIDGSEMWYKNGLLHREEGPAVIYSDGIKEWRKEGELHREEGPAIINWDGIKEYWLNGKRLSKDEWWEQLSDEQNLKALFNGEAL